ncbi:MAG: DUF488 family protein [Chloroflexota bacterium]
MLQILTVGHSNHTVERLLSLLASHDVQVLVDVRSQPYSRFATQFNREQLEPAVSAADLRYLFMGDELGGRQLGGIISTDKRLEKYDEVAASPGFRRGIQRVLKGAETYRIALLCAEEDPTECHRRVWVTRALMEAGANVAHLRGDGRLDPDSALKQHGGFQLDLFDEPDG